MLLVRAYLGSSTIHGIGLFAAELIPQGTRTWELTPPFDLILSSLEVQSLPGHARERFLHFAYHNSNDEYVLCWDDARFANHSNEPNTSFVAADIPYEYAVCDILAGEELTINYAQFDEDIARNAPAAFWLKHKGRSVGVSEITNHDRWRSSEAVRRRRATE